MYTMTGLERHQWEGAAGAKRQLLQALHAGRTRYHDHVLGPMKGRRGTHWAGPKTLFAEDARTHPLRDWLLALLPDGYEIHEAWGVAMDAGVRCRSHDHVAGRNTVAGVYYVQASASGPGGVFYEQIGDDPDTRIEHRVESGDALLFPADLAHGVTRHEGPTRWSIGFNARPVEP